MARSGTRAVKALDASPDEALLGKGLKFCRDAKGRRVRLGSGACGEVSFSAEIRHICCLQTICRLTTHSVSRLLMWALIRSFCGACSGPLTRMWYVFLVSIWNVLLVLSLDKARQITSVQQSRADWTKNACFSAPLITSSLNHVYITWHYKEF